MKSKTLKYWLRELSIMGAVAVAAILFMQWLQRENQRGGGGVLETGSAAPTFVLADAVEGTRTSLESLRGKPVILAFWATWCGACESELPALEAISSAAGDDYAVLSVSRERRSVLKAYLAGSGYTFPVLSDHGGRVHQAYKVSTIPMTVIIDKDGRVVHDFVGAADRDILAEHMARLGGG